MRSNLLLFTLVTGLVALASPNVARATTTFNVTNQAMSAWLFNGANPNEPLTLVRGQTYNFVVNAPGPPAHPFFIASAPGLPVQALSDPGLSGNGTSGGTVTFTPSVATPNTIAYQCGIHTAMTGTINVVNAAVPAVGPWPLLALAALLATFGVAVLRRRRRA